MDNKRLLGKRIKEIRKQKGFTQEQLAEMIDIETGSLSAIESGRHYPSLPTLEKIANSLNIELKALFDYKHHVSVNVMKKEIIDNLDKISNDNLTFVHRFIDNFKS